MSGVRVLVGTRKGAFVLTSDGKREQWDVSGPHFGGWEIYHLKGSPADPNRLYASQSSGWFGQLIQRSDDGGKTWEPVGNKFVYDGVPGTHQWYDGTPHPWEFKRVWHLEPSLTDPDTVYAGVEDAALFRSTDGGQKWQELAGPARPRLRARAGSPARAGCACTRSFWIRPIPGGCSSPSRPRARSAPTTAAQTWRPINRGLQVRAHPRPDAEVGHCVHRIAMHPSRPNVLFMQKHWDVMRTDDAGESWHEVSGNLPTDFGFPIDVHAHEPDTIYVVPIKSDSEHYPPEGKLRVYRSRTGGNEWEPLTKGLPQSDCYVNVLRDAMAVDSLDSCGIYFGTTGGQVYASADAGDNWAPIVRICRPCCRSRSRRCHDPRGAAGPPADAGARRAARWSSTSRAGHAALGARRARSPLSDAARDDPRPRHADAPAVRAVLRLRAGPVPRVAGCPAARCRRLGRGAVSGRGRDRRRLGAIPQVGPLRSRLVTACVTELLFGGWV